MTHGYRGSDISKAMADIAYHLHIGPSHFLKMRVSFFVEHYEHLLRIGKTEHEKAKQAFKVKRPRRK